MLEFLNLQVSGISVWKLGIMLCVLIIAMGIVYLTEKESQKVDQAAKEIEDEK